MLWWPSLICETGSLCLPPFCSFWSLQLNMFYTVRCEDVTKVGNHAWKMFLVFLSLDKVSASCKVLLLLRFV